ncbi:MerR family transcriptional regulator [Streptomyces sp. ISL-1]|uniref:MerR family transcriptional regulator n=1 Tax=Streptomyces sp. ISL-1 TaxID=2817657 RepID=UPI001BEC4FE4|nr:MerR family transcriptional regulator [Streptomyces sp. ISL-1]MBT2390458.1 MerR family transcriptional regulator [Streptomyces sp. ISL-1]
MRIGELSRATGVSTRSLRYYEQQGILTSERRDNGYRDYGPEAPEVVFRIRALLAIGLPTDRIRDILPCEGAAGRQPEACSTLLANIRGIRDSVSAQAAELSRTSDALTHYLSENFA